MQIKLVRYGIGRDSTGGVIFIDGKFYGYTCEDEYRDVKLMDETCIPEGEYEIKLRAEGGMHQRYKEQYDFHEGMLWLQDVPDFEWIYIHPGNNDDHTSGCILVGLQGFFDGSEYTIGRSVDAYTQLYIEVLDALHRGERVFIDVTSLKWSYKVEV